MPPDKKFGEANEGDLARTFRVFDDDCLHGRIIRRTVPWEAVFTEGERISHKFAISKDCRSFDLAHVAVAIVSNLPEFATLDMSQRELARAARLKVIDLSF